jgi:hypothetical protein
MEEARKEESAVCMVLRALASRDKRFGAIV